MNITLFNELRSDALEVSDRETFIADWIGNNRAWRGESGDRAALCGEVWDLAHMSLADIRHALGLTQAQLAERFSLPFRTVTNWEARGSTAPYVRLLIARLGGLTRGLIDEAAVMSS